MFAKPVATAQSLSLLSGAMGAVDYTVPGLVAPLQQNAPMTCWATVITMMENWRRQQSTPVQTVLERAGQAWVDRYNRGESLDVNLAKSLYDALGLVSLISQNPTIEYWEQLLRTYGPLYVDVGAGPTSTHALIVTGIRGNGTDTGTNITFVDPGSGQVVNQRFDTFRQRYEAPSAVSWPYVITHWPAGTTSGQQSLPARYSHSYEAPSTAQTMTVLSTQMNPLLIAGIEVADAAQIGLGAVSVVQAGAAASGGTLTLTFDKAQRLLTSEARAAMPGAQSGKSKYSALVFSIGIGAINAANADIIVEWEGNAYGEVSTPIFRKQLETSTDWSRSSAVITITKLDTIPPANTDPREWPIVFHYEGNYDPWGNGLFEFTGEFEINAFGGLKFNKHQVVSRSLGGLRDRRNTGGQGRARARHRRHRARDPGRAGRLPAVSAAVVGSRSLTHRWPDSVKAGHAAAKRSAHHGPACSRSRTRFEPGDAARTPCSWRSRGSLLEPTCSRRD